MRANAGRACSFARFFAFLQAISEIWKREGEKGNDETLLQNFKHGAGVDLERLTSYGFCLLGPIGLPPNMIAKNTHKTDERSIL